jgi:hypothetical protein
VNYRRVFIVFAMLIGAMACAACAGSSNPITPAPVGGGGTIPAGSASPLATQAGGQNLPPVSGCQARLWGKILDAKGQPIVKVTVLIHGSKEAKTFTDPSGFYGFAGLCAGDYTLSVLQPDGSSQDFPDNIKLGGSQDLKRDLTLK